MKYGIFKISCAENDDEGSVDWGSITERRFEMCVFN